MQRVSIIIPVLNEGSILSQTLLSLQSYRQQGHEVIVVDGGSTDNSTQQALHLTDKLLESHPGRAKQMNSGAQHAKGDILLFLHADSQLPENALLCIQQALSTNPGRVWGRFDVRLSGRHPLLKVIAMFMNLRSCITGIATGDQAMFVLASRFREIKGFPEIPLMEDIRLSRLLLRLSRPVCIHQPLITSSRRWEQKGILRTVFLMWYLRLAHFFGKSPDDLAQIYSR